MEPDNQKSWLENPVVRVFLTLLSLFLLVAGIYGFFLDEITYSRNIFIICISLVYLWTEIKMLINPKTIKQAEPVLDPLLLRRADMAFWWQRLVSFFIDNLICIIFCIIIIKQFQVSPDDSRYFLFGFLIFYYVFAETLFNTTIGKIIFGLKVVDTKSWAIPRFSQILIRTVCRFIPFDAFTFFSQKPTGWHDRFSSTAVIKR